ncbi:hypothetical protein A2U01_0103460, partial [Trifolium medium]|nr:hypothetical protein [Trifolium medium]
GGDEFGDDFIEKVW